MGLGGSPMVAAPGSFPQRDGSGVRLRAVRPSPAGLARAGGGEAPKPPAAHPSLHLHSLGS